MILILDILNLGCWEGIQAEMPGGSRQSGPSVREEKAGLETGCQSHSQRQGSGSTGEGGCDEKDRKGVREEPERN